jgi:hypothetical protein
MGHSCISTLADNRRGAAAGALRPFALKVLVRVFVFETKEHVPEQKKNIDCTPAS